MPVTTPVIRYEVKERVAWITLNRPGALNSLSGELCHGIGEAFTEATQDDEVLAVIFTGEGGKAFCTGADLVEMTERDRAGLPMVDFENGPMGTGGIGKIWECPKPIIAAIDGYAVAGGMQIASRCDFRIATEKSRFGQTEVRRSLAPVACGDTPELFMPIGEAKWILMSGSLVTAQRMYQMGYLQALLPDRDALFAEAERMANEIKQAAPLAVQAIKVTLKFWENFGYNMDFAKKLAKPWKDRVARSEDRIEGPRAFAEKRKPNWKQR